MPKYKVISLAVSGLGNKIFRPDDVVTERNFPPGNIKHLVDTGAVELIPEEEAEEVALTADPPEEKKPEISEEGKDGTPVEISGEQKQKGNRGGKK